ANVPCADRRALARSPALAWALATSLSTVRRIRPHRSGVQLADDEVLNELATNPDLPKPVLLLEPPPARERCALALRSTGRKKAARACATSHSACWNAASAALRFWLEMSICFSRSSSSGSW